MGIIKGNLIDVKHREIYPCVMTLHDKKNGLIERNSNVYERYIPPEFIDAHVHVESSMLLSIEFSKLAIINGTVGIVANPHKIANILDVKGIRMMIDHGNQADLKYFWDIPSRVPVTPLNKSGCILTVKDTEELAKTGQFMLFSEVMNIPGMSQDNPEMIGKIEGTKKYGLKINGHVPTPRGDNLTSHVAHGIKTDHECFTLEETEDKIEKGMRVIIRDESAAKKHETLESLIATNTGNVMFCTDDSQAGDLLYKGHINKIVKQALRNGFNLFNIWQVACLNAVHFYHLNVGTLHVGDQAEFIVSDDLKTLNVRATYIQGEKIYGEGLKKEFATRTTPLLNTFHHDEISLHELETTLSGDLLCIQVIPDNLITHKKVVHLGNRKDKFQSDIDADFLKIVYVNRYFNSPPQVGFITGIGLKSGAFSSSISHDLHNTIAVGCTDDEIAASINGIIKGKGGLVVQQNQQVWTLPLPVGGIMNDKTDEEVAEQYSKLNRVLAAMGCPLNFPFMTLSFMALVVIPSLKIMEKGLFNYEKFDFV